MSNYALIFAGGSGTRMNTKAIPKQFLELQGCSIIIHTLRHFQSHSQIDAICVVCIESWIEELKKQLCFHHITKVKSIVPGGTTGQKSIYNGLLAISKFADQDKRNFVLIHDGVRPLINADIISKNISCAQTNGNAITVAPANESIVYVDDAENVCSISDRNHCRLARAPQTFDLKDILDAHKKAIADGELSMIDSAALMSHYGHKLHTVDGPMENIKVTTPLDFHLFRAILQTRENEQLSNLL